MPRMPDPHAGTAELMIPDMRVDYAEYVLFGGQQTMHGGSSTHRP